MLKVRAMCSRSGWLLTTTGISQSSSPVQRGPKLHTAREAQPACGGFCITSASEQACSASLAGTSMCQCYKLMPVPGDHLCT